jgi:Catalase-related immune-responsive
MGRAAPPAPAAVLAEHQKHDLTLFTINWEADWEFLALADRAPRKEPETHTFDLRRRTLDGLEKTADNRERGTFELNSLGGPVEDPRFKEPPLKISGDADHYDHREGNDDYTQAGHLFRLMSKVEQDRLFANTAPAMTACLRKLSCGGSALRQG